MNSCIFIFWSPLFPLAFLPASAHCFPPGGNNAGSSQSADSTDVEAFAFGAPLLKTGDCFFVVVKIGDWKQIVFSPNIHTHVWLQLMASLEHSVLDKGQWRRCNASARRAIPQRSVAPHMNAWWGKIIRRVESAKASCFCTPSESVCVCVLWHWVSD